MHPLTFGLPVAINFVRCLMESKQSSEAEAIIWEVSERYGSQLPSDHPLLQCSE